MHQQLTVLVFILCMHWLHYTGDAILWSNTRQSCHNPAGWKVPENNAWPRSKPLLQVFTGAMIWVSSFSAGKQAAASRDIPRSVGDVSAGTAELSQQPAHPRTTPSSPQTPHCGQTAVGGAEYWGLRTGPERPGKLLTIISDCVDIYFVHYVLFCSMG